MYAYFNTENDDKLSVGCWSCHWGTSHRCFSSEPTIVLHHTCCPFEYLTIHTHTCFRNFEDHVLSQSKNVCSNRIINKPYSTRSLFAGSFFLLRIDLAGSLDDPNMGIQVLEHK